MCKNLLLFSRIFGGEPRPPYFCNPQLKKGGQLLEKNSSNKEQKGLVGELIMCTFAAR